MKDKTPPESKPIAWNKETPAYVVYHAGSWQPIIGVFSSRDKADAYVEHFKKKYGKDDVGAEWVNDKLHVMKFVLDWLKAE